MSKWNKDGSLIKKLLTKVHDGMTKQGSSTYDKVELKDFRITGISAPADYVHPDDFLKAINYSGNPYINGTVILNDGINKLELTFVAGSMMVD